MIDGVKIAARITEKDGRNGKTWTGSGKKRSVKLYVAHLHAGSDIQHNHVLLLHMTEFTSLHSCMYVTANHHCSDPTKPIFKDICSFFRGRGQGGQFAPPESGFPPPENILLKNHFVK